jgi:hypothetical protein
MTDNNENNSPENPPTPVIKRGRGRPKGSKNKPKPVIRPRKKNGIPKELLVATTTKPGPGRPLVNPKYPTHTSKKAYRSFADISEADIDKYFELIVEGANMALAGAQTGLAKEMVFERPELVARLEAARQAHLAPFKARLLQIALNEDLDPRAIANSLKAIMWYLEKLDKDFMAAKSSETPQAATRLKLTLEQIEELAEDK